jgi:hypothetical protein
MLGWMIVDGVGLAIIATCTIMEGFDLWRDYFSEYSDDNMPSIMFWISGRLCQVMGLLFLISHAASFQLFPEIEKCGMAMLTTGPLLNLIACSLFDSGHDPVYLYNSMWLSSECLELLGISILDLSLIDTEEYLVLTAEITGFVILGCAAILDIEYSADDYTLPTISLRMDVIHVSDCFGLFLLSVVAVAQYQMKIAAHRKEMQIKEEFLRRKNKEVGHDHV